jgi:hypothetical protein
MQAVENENLGSIAHEIQQKLKKVIDSLWSRTAIRMSWV